MKAQSFPFERNWFKVLSQAVDEGIVTIDNRGRITSFNPGAERITGWSCEDTLSKSINAILQIADGERNLLDPFPGDGLPHQINLHRRDGRSAPFLIAAYPWISPVSGVNETAIIIRELPEGQLLQNLRKKFLEDITQEFLTPLAALNASVELLLDEVDQLSSSQIKELTGSMHISVKELHNLIENLLESINIEAGSFFVRLQPVKLERIIYDALNVVRPILSRRSQVVRVEINTHHESVKGDPARLQHVLVNLLLNASKFGPVNQEIALKAVPEVGNMVRISVTDMGPGIPPQDRENLFGRFMNIRTKDGAQSGIGLGLSVVKSIVREHGGQVGVDFSPSGGSVFWFTIHSGM